MRFEILLVIIIYIFSYKRDEILREEINIILSVDEKSIFIVCPYRDTQLD